MAERLRTTIGWVCAAVALGALLVGWLQPPPDLSRDDARTVAQRSLDHVDVEGARVAPTVVARTFEREGRDAVDVWVTSATVRGFAGTIELQVDRGDGTLVHLDDRSDDQSSRLLSDEQFARFDGYATNPAQDRRLRRNLLLTVAAAGTMLMAVAHASRLDQRALAAA